MADLAAVFKAANLFVAFGSGTTLLEFQVPPLTHQYASFLFSFLGRGVFYILLGILISKSGALSIINGLLVIIIGAVFIALEFVPSIEAPDNFRTDGGVLIDDEENEVI
ncbi:hypothetical protein WICPIJ_001709 [Wickerhamomyces pijperi]|uniref:Golgi apparatus membrane protein TVP15 n=1 Tax=Wickerhamomyces pijperi TaxID=599730 RepID=A0A9P8TQB0_WICPI|nr:hypothetical protein WICPIJ_001709 [Wickerhamomyces pijperi]